MDALLSYQQRKDETCLDHGLNLAGPRWPMDSALPLLSGDPVTSPPLSWRGQHASILFLVPVIVVFAILMVSILLRSLLQQTPQITVLTASRLQIEHQVLHAQPEKIK